MKYYQATLASFLALTGNVFAIPMPAAPPAAEVAVKRESAPTPIEAPVLAREADPNPVEARDPETTVIIRGEIPEAIER